MQGSTLQPAKNNAGYHFRTLKNKDPLIIKTLKRNGQQLYPLFRPLKKTRQFISKMCLCIYKFWQISIPKRPSCLFFKKGKKLRNLFF